MGSEEGTECGLYLKGPEFLGTYFTGAGLLERCSARKQKGCRASIKSCQL